MSEMIERVAQAISSSFHEEGYIEGLSDPSEWEEFRKAAREAIRAMREPTAKMLAAPKKIMGGGFQNSHSDDETWEAMIDEALRDDSPKGKSNV